MLIDSTQHYHYSYMTIAPLFDALSALLNTELKIFNNNIYNILFIVFNSIFDSLICHLMHYNIKFHMHVFMHSLSLSIHSYINFSHITSEKSNVYSTRKNDSRIAFSLL